MATTHPMHDSRRRRPGILLLGRGRVLVASGDRRSVELLHLARTGDERGVWTLLNPHLENDVHTNFLVNFKTADD